MGTEKGGALVHGDAKAAPDTGTASKTSGPVPADSRQ